MISPQLHRKFHITTHLDLISSHLVRNPAEYHISSHLPSNPSLSTPTQEPPSPYYFPNTSPILHHETNPSPSQHYQKIKRDARTRFGSISNPTTPTKSPNSKTNKGTPTPKKRKGTSLVSNGNEDDDEPLDGGAASIKKLKKESKMGLMPKKEESVVDLYGADENDDAAAEGYSIGGGLGGVRVKTEAEMVDDQDVQYMGRSEAFGG